MYVLCIYVSNVHAHLKNVLFCAFTKVHSCIVLLQLQAQQVATHPVYILRIRDQIVLAREHVTGFGKLSLIARCVFQEKPVEMFKKTLWLSCGR